MAGFGGFYKGEKKKQKKNKQSKNAGGTYSTAPTFTAPEVVSRKKTEY